MRCAAVLLVGAMLAAAQTPPAALVRGVLLECDARASGQFSIRGSDNRVFRYEFDPKTYVERESRMIDMRTLSAGEKLEVLSDSLPDSSLRYARTVHVVETPPPDRPQSAGRYRAPRRVATEELPPRTGTLTYSGVVFRITPESVAIHLRDGTEQSILLRKDTRYLQNGSMVDAASLKPNMRIFVRAGKSVYDEVEAYQIIWGRILDP